MALSKRDLEEIDQLHVLHTVTSVYGEIASLWMKKARDSILKSRDYMSELNHVFLTTFSSYAREIQQLAKKRDGKITFLAHNGQKVGVFLAANTGFYGDIIKRTFDLFAKDIRELDLEATIIGRQGLTMFQAEFPNKPYTFFELPDERVDQPTLLNLVKHLVQYEQIRIYYGRFENFVKQDAIEFTLSANPYENLQQTDQVKRYLFEPSIEKVLLFFEKQMFASVFEQTVRESQLAKQASRIMVMDQASQNIKERLGKIQYQQLQRAHQQANRKQLNVLTSMRLWQAG